MKCPLLMAGWNSARGGEQVYEPDCLKEECAWWVKASESCAMEAIPRIIGFLGSELKGIKESMPKDLAPRG